MQTVVTKKTKKWVLPVVIVSVIVGLLLIMGAIFAVAGISDYNQGRKLQEQLDLGERYLGELDYEAAIAAYEMAIEIDPKSVEAYLGLADVYVAIEEYEKAIEVLEDGLEETDSEEIIDRIEEIEELIEELENSEEEVDVVPEETLPETGETEAPEDEAVKELYPDFSKYISEYIHHYPGIHYTKDDVDYEELLGFAYSYIHYNHSSKIYREEGFDGECIAATDVNDCVNEFFGVEIPLQTHGAVEYKEDAFYFTKEYFTNGGDYLAVIKEAIHLEDKYYIKFQDVYVRWDGNSYSDLDSYYSMDYDTVKDDSNCDVYNEGTCILQEIDGEWAIVEFTLDRDEKAVAESRADIFEWNGHYYAIYDNAPSWSEAVAFCESQRGHMATISSQEENDALFEFINGMGYRSAYFGYCDDVEEGNFYWIGEEENTYSNWHLPNEPNAENSREDYGMFYYKYPDGTWNDGDFGGNTVNGGTVYICEWDSKEAYEGTLEEESETTEDSDDSAVTDDESESTAEE